jgi:hypothetical protein
MEASRTAIARRREPAILGACRNDLRGSLPGAKTNVTHCVHDIHAAKPEWGIGSSRPEAAVLELPARNAKQGPVWPAVPRTAGRDGDHVQARPPGTRNPRMPGPEPARVLPIARPLASPCLNLGQHMVTKRLPVPTGTALSRRIGRSSGSPGRARRIVARDREARSRRDCGETAPHMAGKAAGEQWRKIRCGTAPSLAGSGTVRIAGGRPSCTTGNQPVQ